MRPPRPARAAAGLVGVLLLAAACAQPPAAAAAPPPLSGMTPVPVVAIAPPPPPPPNRGFTLTAEQTTAALLAKDDVPADWHGKTAPPAEAPSTSLGFAAPDALSVDPAPCVDLGVAGGPTTPQTAFSEVGFLTPDKAYVTEQVSVWPDESAGAGMVAAAQSWVASCPTFTFTSQDGSDSTFQLTQLGTPALGDQAVGLRIAAQRTLAGAVAGAFTIDTALVVVGNVVVELVAGGEATLDPALFAQLTSTAVAKALAAAA